jgi:hypothetical protein
LPFFPAEHLTGKCNSINMNFVATSWGVSLSSFTLSFSSAD